MSQSLHRGTSQNSDVQPESIPLQNRGNFLSLKKVRVKKRTSISALSKQPLLHEEPFCPDEVSREQSRPLIKAWTPWMLQRWVLSLFAIIFMLLVVGLEIVLKVSTDKHGFGPTTLNLHYVWTYGPTAAAFWTQVDYRTRQMQPWKELAKKVQPAENSLLLDYISPHPIPALVTSMRKRHWPVSAVFIGSALLKIATIVSSALFSLHFIKEAVLLPINMKEQFQLSKFNSSNVDYMAASLYAAVMTNGISYPVGINSRFAVETFNTSHEIKADTYNLTANAMSFTANLACEPAVFVGDMKLTCPAGTSCTHVYATLATESKTCRISSFPNNITSFSVSGNDVGHWYGSVLPGTCEDGKGGDPNRLVAFNFVQSEKQKMINSTVLICKPSFSMQHSKITFDESGSLQTVENSKQLEAPSSSLTARDIADATIKTISQVGIDSVGFQLAGSNEVPSLIFDSFFWLILASQGARDIKDLSNLDLLTKGAQDVFQGVAAQIGNRYLLVANGTNPVPSLVGEANYEQQRLFVRPVSMRLLESLLCILAFLSILLVFMASRNVTPQDPASIARFTSLISESKDLNNTLSSTGSWSIKKLKNVLRGRYKTNFVPTTNDPYKNPLSFVIEANGVNGQKSVDVDEGFWEPLMTKLYVRVTLPVISLCLIIALELTFRKSQTDQGLLDVMPNRTTQLGSSYIPALIMVLTKLLFSAFDFNLRIADPYVQLKNGFAKAKSSVLNKTIYTWKIDAFWTSFINGRFAVGASALATIIASFLTIAASGLYIPDEVAHNSPVSLTRLDQFFNPVFMPQDEPGKPKYTPVSLTSSLAARLVVYEKMSSPIWTDGPYVLPTLSNTSNNAQGLDEISFITVQLPVQRGFLTCDLIPSNQVTLNYTTSTNTANNATKMRVQILWSMPNVNLSACSNFGYNASLASAQFTSAGDGFFTQWNNFQFLSTDANANCPTTWGLYGNWQGQQASELNVMTCWSSIQESQASAQFSIPNWKIRSLTVDEHTAKVISTTMDTQLDLSGSVFRGMAAGEFGTVFNAFLRSGASNSLDTSLLKRENFDKLYRQIQNVYSLAFAQVLNNQGRNGSIAEKPSILGTATSFSSFRLKQNLASTRLLQGLLIGLIVCSIICLVTVHLAQVLPKNSCSIAAQASLVAGSTMMATLPAGTQWMEDKEFNALFERSTYSMGWVEEEDGEREFRIDTDTVH